MGYKIMYSPEDNNKYPTGQSGRKHKWLLPVIIILALLMSIRTAQVRDRLEEWIIPGNDQITKAAFSVMIDEIRTGEPVTEAVTAFCRVIIENGNTEDSRST